MKTLKLNQRIKLMMSKMFDAQYQVSVLTEHRGNIDYDEVLSEKNGLQLKIKHLAAFMAIASLEADQALDYNDKYPLLKKIARQFRNDSEKTVRQMNIAFSILMSELVQLN